MALELVSSFSERLKEALEGISITDFGNKIGLSKQAISAYTLGTRKPKRPTIYAIAKVLNVNEAWLIGYNVPKTPSSHGEALLEVTPEEAELIRMYRGAPSELKELTKYALKNKERN